MTKSVLISGASSGIGRAFSLELDRKGYQVFAGVRKASDGDALRSQASPRLIPVLLDITLPESISSTCNEVSRKTGGELYCLINNAGISISGAMEFIPTADFREQIEVNLVGQLRLTQAFLPMLRKTTGRLIFVSSIAGRWTTPFNGPYGISKAGLNAMADVLRIELTPWKIPVSLLIIGSVQTPIWEKSAVKAGELIRRSPRQTWEMYGKAQQRAGMFYQEIGRNGLPVEKTLRSIRQLLENDHPKAYVLVGNDALLYELLVKLLPIRLRDWLVRKRMGLLNI